MPDTHRLVPERPGTHLTPAPSADSEAVPQAVLNTQYSYRQGRLACQLRAALTCVVFRKALLVGASDMAAFSSGAVQTLMSVDADRVVNLCLSLHELWSLPAQIGIALYLLWTQVRPAGLGSCSVPAVC